MLSSPTANKNPIKTIVSPKHLKHGRSKSIINTLEPKHKMLGRNRELSSQKIKAKERESSFVKQFKNYQ